MLLILSVRVTEEVSEYFDKFHEEKVFEHSYLIFEFKYY